jgi:glutathione S-transferase
MPGHLRRPFLFGKQPTMADAMYAPVVTRFLTYDVPLGQGAPPPTASASWTCPPMQEWVAAAKAEPDEIDELDAEF